MWNIIGANGTEVPLTGLSVAIRSAPGSGMPPIDNVLVEQAGASGAQYQRSWTGTRRLTLRMVSRQRQAILHTTRLALVEALNPDLVRAERPAYLEYAGVHKTLRLPVVYDGGLEDSDGDALELRFLAHDPFWARPEPISQPLTTLATHDPADYLLRRSAEGVWSAFPSIGGAVNTILASADSTIYVGGAFAGGVKRWDGQQWVTLTGTGSTQLNGAVTCLAESPDGTIYAGGLFTLPGVAVAAWDGTDWTATGDPQIEPKALVVGNDGSVYVGGSDTSSPATGITVKRWQSSTDWVALGSGPGGTVHSLLSDTDGTLLAGGAFAGGVKRWSGASWQTLGGGIADTVSGTPLVSALARSSAGLVFAGGDFDRADSALSQNIAYWNGAAWTAPGAGVGAPVNTLAAHPSSAIVIAAGQFTVANNLAMPDKMARWNGYAWFPLDVNIQQTPDPDIIAVAVAPDQALLVGYGVQASAISAAVTTITNQGTAAAYPVLTVTGPGSVTQLVNWTAGEALYFNLELLDGEVLTVDLRPQYKTITSSFHGNLLGKVVPGSTLATWRLLPGENRVSLLVDDAGASATLTWYERHWSLDGADIA